MLCGYTLCVHACVCGIEKAKNNLKKKRKGWRGREITPSITNSFCCCACISPARVHCSRCVSEAHMFVGQCVDMLLVGAEQHVSQ